MFPYSRQDINSKDIKAVLKVLKSDFLTQGPIVPKFEKAVAKKVGSKYAVATNSATSALHIACMALGLKKGEILWTVSNTFVASANCGRYCGAKIDFVDIDPKTYNICTLDLKKKLIFAKKKKILPKILVVVHFAGQPAEIEKIKNLSKIYKFKIIEDASHAFGAHRDNNWIGNCKFSDIAIFSFHPVKTITSAEGGMALTNNFNLFKKMDLFRLHGITKKKQWMKKKITSNWYCEQLELGYNYRMSDIHAAIGLSQLYRIDKIVKKRNQIANRYFKLLKDLPIDLPYIDKKNYSSFHLFVIKLRLKKISRSHEKIINLLRKNKILVNLHYLPVHLQPYYKNLLNKKKILPITESYAKSALSIPVYFSLKNKEQDFIIKKLREILI